MSSPFANKVKPATPITERQLDFLCELQKQVLVLEGYTSDDVLEFMNAFELQARQLGTREASETINARLNEVRALKAAQRERESETDSDLPGFWELPDGRIVKVQVAVYGSRRPYGKVLNTDVGKFIYHSAVINDVRREGTRLTLERAKELGHLYGLCVRCGATLTDEDSIAAGIGPVCATKF